MCASTLCPLDSSTRNIAFGRASTMAPSSSMTPSFFGMSSHFCRRRTVSWTCLQRPPDEASGSRGHNETEATKSQGMSVRHYPPETQSRLLGRSPAGLQLAQVLGAPGVERDQRLVERLPERRERVLDLGWHLVEHLAVHDVARLELPHLLDQHLLGDAGHLPAQLPEPIRAVVQLPQDARFPLPADHVGRGVQSTGVRAHTYLSVST